MTTKDYIEIPDQPPPVVTESKTVEKPDDTNSANGARRPSKKRVKMADLKNLIETKILSKSDRGLEKIGVDPNGKGLQHAVIYFQSIKLLF